VSRQAGRFGWWGGNMMVVMKETINNKDRDKDKIDMRAKGRVGGYAKNKEIKQQVKRMK
jgi:hypothetical protein